MRKIDNSPESFVDLKVQQPLPVYMEEVYDWAYVDPKNVEKLDRNMVVKTLLFGNDQRLMSAYLKELNPGQRVWQVAHVYGDLVRRVAEKVGNQGVFHLTDVTAIQVEHAQRKLKDAQQAHVFHLDASKWTGSDYDVVCSFFLLHEIPEEKKRAVVNRMLKAVRPEGKLVFVDYHRPQWWQPVGWILRWVNQKLEPFAHALWEKEIASYSDQPERFTWEKRTIFGGVYQIVIAKPKNGIKN